MHFSSGVIFEDFLAAAAAAANDVALEADLTAVVDDVLCWTVVEEEEEA
jgi:hypothetical protein